jgi:hypothetical protein
MQCFKVLFYSILCIFVVAGCMNESGKQIKEKLIVILDDDLKTIVGDISKENLADSVYYTIVSYKDYKEYRYRKMAVVDFYFMKNVSVKIVRKYRYHSLEKKWERYFNEYKFYDNKK